MKNKNYLLVGLGSVLLAVGLFIALTQTTKPQETRTRGAAGTATLALVPSTSNKQVGDTIALDMMLNPGTSLVSFVKFQIEYDDTKIELSTSDPFTLNTASFPVKVEGPIVSELGTIGESVSVGADPTKVIQAPTKVGTLNFKAISGTGNSPTKVAFTALTQVLSTGPNDRSYESVLASTTPANITIGGSGQTTPSVTPNLTTTPIASATPLPSGTTTISFDLLLHGVGNAGDNPNPTGNSLSNKTPLHPQRKLDVLIYNSSNQIVSSASGAINYDDQSGAFRGAIAFTQAIREDNYILKVRTPSYLRKQVPGIQKIKPFQDNRIPQTALVAGDTNGDNVLDVLDYNAFLDCGYGVLEPLPMDDANSMFKKQACQNHKPPENIDSDDNGIVDSSDYNLFLRELSVQDGD